MAEATERMKLRLADPDEAVFAISMAASRFATEQTTAAALALMRMIQARVVYPPTDMSITDMLTEVAEGLGPYKRDQLEHATAVIEYTKSLAARILRAAGEERDDGR